MWFRRRKDRAEGHSWWGLHRPFDQKYRTVTSGIVQPWVLFIIRLVIAFYCLVTSIAHIIIYGTQPEADYNLYFAYFTRLSFIGVTAYFCASALHTGIFVLSLRQLKRGTVSRAPWFPLQRWGRFLQFLHMLLFSTIITMPIVTTIVFWAFLSGPTNFSTPFAAWSNISFHIFNTVFLVVELVFGRLRLHWGYLLPCIVILGMYLGLAYLVHAVDSVWVYSFFDTSRPNAKASPAVFIVGILLLELVAFVVIWGLIHLRDWIFPRGRGVRVVERHGGQMVV